VVIIYVFFLKFSALVFVMKNDVKEAFLDIVHRSFQWKLKKSKLKKPKWHGPDSVELTRIPRGSTSNVVRIFSSRKGVSFT
jgi:hypothetical protein